RSEGRRVIFGLANPRDTGFKGGVDWTWLDPTLEVALARFPWFAELRLDRAASWFGHYELTPDGRPVVGEMPGAPGWFNACGFS
ncbi:FAD-dependent oxidoreductase, partial [Deinococcus pimensis]|uniref:FAD-dependent oxidoreductase n=1 Tax=Deinococcus pimensis TaxID=309888 RepID=UPI0005EBBA50